MFAGRVFETTALELNFKVWLSCFKAPLACNILFLYLQMFWNFRQLHQRLHQPRLMKVVNRYGTIHVIHNTFWTYFRPPFLLMPSCVVWWHCLELPLTLRFPRIIWMAHKKQCLANDLFYYTGWKQRFIRLESVKNGLSYYKI